MRPASAEKPIKLHVTIQNQVSHAMVLSSHPAYIIAALGKVFMHGCMCHTGLGQHVGLRQQRISRINRFTLFAHVKFCSRVDNAAVNLL